MLINIIITQKAFSYMTCLNPENISLWCPEDMKACIKSMKGYDIDSEDLIDNGSFSPIVFQFNDEFLKGVGVFSSIRDHIGERKYKEYVNEFMKGIKKKIEIENESRKRKKKGTRKRIPQSMFTCMSNVIYKLLSKESNIKNSQRSQSDCNDKDISTLSIQSNDKDISTLSIQSTGDEDRSRCSKKRQYTSDYDDVEDDDNDGDYCDIKRKRISAEQRRKRSDINRKNSNKRWHKDG